jgi:acetylornithine deacetylase/succinyl-diaminopimelate desuccinylase-like protein
MFLALLLIQFLNSYFFYLMNFDPREYIVTNQDKFLDELFRFIRIPSVSADGNYKNDVIIAAEYLRKRLLEAGVDEAQVIPTPGHPLVFASKTLNPSFPTILIYGHYDVQPADPLELWTSPPFDPVIRNEKIYARGACDDKGQLMMQILAFEALLKNDALQFNVKFLIEGEEEIGSVNLDDYVKNNVSKLAADLVMISDTDIFANDTPSITTSLRGLCYLEIEVTGPNRDLHSGTYGGAVGNPANILCKMIASLKDEDNRVTIPGFYDKVIDYDLKTRNEINQAPFNLEDYKKELNIRDVDGEQGYTTIERAGIRPSLDVNGIWGGYTGEGAKTILPSKASAKVSMRLVPDQDSKEIARLFTSHILSIAPESVKVKVTNLHGGEPAMTPTDSVAYKAASEAFRESWGKYPLPMLEGGSIPVVSLFKKELGADSILLGFGLKEDAIHSPNESFGLFNFFRGTETIILFYKYFAAMKGKNQN